MNDIGKDGLEQKLERALGLREDAAIPAFDAVFATAKRRVRARRRSRRIAAAGVAAAIAALAVLLLPPPEPAARYVEIEDLLATTKWRAPSDVLLPRRAINLYEDLPVMIESTGPAEGALL
jgi:hypothetical protein